MKIMDLYENELVYWTHANQKFLGITPIDDTWPFEQIQESINDDAEKFWNSDTPCRLARNLNNGTLNHQASMQEKNSYSLKLNFYNMCIDVYGVYDGKKYKIAAIPTPCIDLSWIIKHTHYVPRVTAVKDFFGIVRKIDFETVRGEGWAYDIRSDKFECLIKSEEGKFDPTIENIMSEHLSIRSRCLLQAVIDEPLTKDNFTRALRKLPTFSPDSIFNYKFSRIEYFEDIVLNSKKYAQPTKHILLGVNTMIASKAKQYSTSGEKLEGCLTSSTSKIFALENFRTCVNIFNSGSNVKPMWSKRGTKKKKEVRNAFQPAFTYADTNGFFDSFKTVTSKSAGRQRLLLDNVVIKQGMLFIVEKDGTLHNMFEYLDMPQAARLSCLSESPFCNNDKPKRIMMNAKMTSQAVPLADETDPLTHRIEARAGFTDIEGYTTADSIIISESFAEKLRTFDKTILYLNKKSNVYLLLSDNPIFDINLLKQVFPAKNDAILYNYENVKVDRIEDVDDNNARIFLSWEIPFGLGDKITNLHGAKGTVGRIFPDDEMPRLTRKVGNMEPGPLDIIFSGFSTMRRGSLGQIFEGWARASGIEIEDGEDFIANAIEKYKDQMKEYNDNSIVTYNGESNIIPVGINHIMRLYHHASTHVSCSSADAAYKKTLRFGEMEKLNLVANDCPNILKELGIRSLSKYVGSHKLIEEMQTTRTLPVKTHMTLQFIEILKSIGYDLEIAHGKDKLDSYTENMDEVDIENFNSLFKKELYDDIND